MNLNSFLCGTLLIVASTDMSAEVIEPSVQQNFVKTGRYSLSVNEPRLSQRNPLKVVVITRIPTTVKTVKQAVIFLLLRSGYDLAPPEVLKPDAKILLGHKLPEVHRQLGPMTLDKALEMLAGEAFELVVDPINRKIAYVSARDLEG